MEKLLVGLDGSAHERLVLDAARGLAEKLGARLVLYRAVPLPVEIPANALGVTPASLGDMLLDAAKTHLAELARGEAEIVELNTPWRGLCEAAKREKVDLIVIGSHGYGGLDRVLGTTAARVVNHADRSVLVVRERQGA